MQNQPRIIFRQDAEAEKALPQDLAFAHAVDFRIKPVIFTHISIIQGCLMYRSQVMTTRQAVHRQLALFWLYINYQLDALIIIYS